MKRPPMPPALRTWGLRGLKLWLGWLLVSTVLLNQPWIDDWINRKPERAHVDWGFALSLVPGHAWAWQVTFRGHSRRQAFAIHAREASTWWVPWALADRRIRFTGLEAEGVAVHVQPGQVELPPPPARAHPWTVELAGASARELWSLRFDDRLHATGRAEAHLDLRKVLAGGEIGIAGGQLAWRDLRLAALGKPRILGGTLAGDFGFGPMVPAGTTAWEKLAQVRADLVLDLQVPPLAWDADGVHGDPGDAAAGRLAGRLRLAGGRPGEGTDLALRQPVHVVGGDVDERRELSARLHYEASDLRLQAALPPGRARGTVVAVDLRLPRPGAAQVDAIAAGDVPGTSLAGTTLAGATGSVDLRLRFASLDLLDPWLSRWRGLQADGEGWMHARLRLADGQLLDDSTLAFEDAVLRLGALGHRVEARLDGPVERIADAPRRHRLVLQDVRLLGADDAVLLDGAQARLEFIRSRPDSSVLEPPDLAFALDDAALPDLRVFDRYLPPGALHFRGGAARLSLALGLEPDARTARGVAALASDDADIAIGELPVRGRVAAGARLAEADLASHDLVVEDLAVDLRDVRFSPPGARRPVTGWWLAAAIPRATATVGKPLSLAGQGRLDMRDLSLVLALYAQASDYPGWLLRLADAGRVEAHGDFGLRDGVLSLDGVRAENRRFKVDARLRLGQEARRGAMLVQWGVLAVGVELSPGGSRMHVAGARDWYHGAPR